MMTASMPVFPGETVVSYGDGFGQTTPPRVNGLATIMAGGQFPVVAASVEGWLKLCTGVDCTYAPAVVAYAIAYPESPIGYQVAFTLPLIAVESTRQYSLVVRVGGKFAPDLPLNLAARP